MRIVKINTGRAIKHSAKGGAIKTMRYRDMRIHVDNTERDRFDEGGRLPHQGQREIARRAKRISS